MSTSQHGQYNEPNGHKPNGHNKPKGKRSFLTRQETVHNAGKPGPSKEPPVINLTGNNDNITVDEQPMKRTRTKVPNCMDFKNVTLREHQKKVVNYMLATRRKGLIMYHGTGSGKTITSLAVAKCLMSGRIDNVVVIVPSSVLVQWEMVCNDLRLPHEKIQILSKDIWTRDFEKNRHTVTNMTLVIVDEAHNFRTDMEEGNRAQDMKRHVVVVMETCRLAGKVLFLTATPVWNMLSDLRNMLLAVDGMSGSELPKNSIIRRMDMGLTESNLNSITRCKFSYHDGVSVEKPTYEIRKENIEMSIKYLDDVYYPIETQNFTKVKVHDVSEWKDRDMTVFYNGIKQAANGFDPSINSATLGDMQDRNPKVHWLLNNIRPWVQAGEQVVIYTHFNKFGKEYITKLLDYMKISNRVIVGETRPEARANMVTLFNRRSIQALVITDAGGEGIDLKGVCRLVMFEQPWNQAKIDQVIGRAVRIGSHAHLPANQRHVTIHQLILMKPSLDRIRQLVPRDRLQEYKDKIGFPAADVLMGRYIRNKIDLADAVTKSVKRTSINRDLNACT